jgi:hypothetical protein
MDPETTIVQINEVLISAGIKVTKIGHADDLAWAEFDGGWISVDAAFGIKILFEKFGLIYCDVKIHEVAIKNIRKIIKKLNEVEKLTLNAR